MHLGLPSAAEMYAAVAASGNIISICVWVLVIFCSICAYISMPTCRCGWQKNSRPLPAAHTPLLDNRRSQAAFAPRSSQHHPAEGAFSKRAKPTPRRESPGSPAGDHRVAARAGLARSTAQAEIAHFLSAAAQCCPARPPAAGRSQQPVPVRCSPCSPPPLRPHPLADRQSVFFLCARTESPCFAYI
jgi:hypothetical protein